MWYEYKIYAYNVNNVKSQLPLYGTHFLIKTYP